MNSDSEDFEVNQVTTSFFDGLSKVTKLSQKQTSLRNSIREDSHLPTKATSLQ
jgi:hypothetical protein